MKSLWLATIASLIVGYFVGREHLKYEMRQVFSSTVGSFRESLGQSLGAKPQIEESPSAEEADYINQFLTIDEINVERDVEVRSGSATLISGKLKNVGTRSLSTVQITVYFLDASGRRVFEDTYHPVLDSSFDDKGPLKPNYVRSFSFGVRDVPSEWEQKIEVEITKINFVSPQ